MNTNLKDSLISQPTSVRSFSRARGMGLSLAFLLTATFSGAQSLYWDLNGSSSGSGSNPNGWWVNSNWSFFRNWNTNADGTGSTTRWTNGRDAVFAAGTDADNSNYQVNLWNTVQVGSVTVDSAQVTFEGGDIQFTDSSPDFTVGNGSTAIMNGTRITGNNGLTKKGEGTLVYQGTANNYTGTTAVEQGTLRLGSSNQIDDNSEVRVDAGATLDLGSNSETIDRLNGNGLVNIGSNGTLTVGANNGSSIFGGTLSGDGNFIKTGNGTFTFNNDVLFNGSVFLNGGTLDLNGFDIGFDSLFIGADSIIDFGSSGSSLSLNTLELADGVTLTIENWQDGENLFITQDWIDATYDENGDPMNRVIFEGFTGDDTQWKSIDGEIGPVVPEPSTYGAFLIGFSIVGWMIRRPRRTTVA